MSPAQHNAIRLNALTARLEAGIALSEGHEDAYEELSAIAEAYEARIRPDSTSRYE